MFVRWKTAEPREEKWFNRGMGPYWRAYLVESVRIDGKPRQKQHYLASIKNGHLDGFYHRAVFWHHVYTKLNSLHLTDEQIQALDAAIQQRVPAPPNEAYEENRQALNDGRLEAWLEAEEKAEAAYLAWGHKEGDPEHPIESNTWWRAALWVHEHNHGSRSADKSESHEYVGTTAEEVPS